MQGMDPIRVVMHACMHGIWVRMVAIQGMDLNLGCYAQGMHGIWVHVVAMQGMDLNLGCYARHAWNLGSHGCYVSMEYGAWPQQSKHTYHT